MEREAPIELVRCLEIAIEGERADAVIFAMGLVLGQVILACVPAEDHDEVVEACVDAIRIGLRAAGTETVN